MSHLERIRQKRVSIPDRLFTAEIPGYDGELVVRFRLYEYEEAQKAIKKLRKRHGDDAELLAKADMLVRHCEGLYARDPDNPENLVPLDPAEDDPPVFGPELATLLEIPHGESMSARACLFAVFNHDFAVAMMESRLAAFSAGVSEEEIEEARGE